MKKILEEYGLYLLIGIAIAIAIYELFFKKISVSENVNIKSDTGGGPTDNDKAQSKILAARLNNEMNSNLMGLFSNDVQVFADLAATSDVVFSLTFAAYNELTGQTLLKALNGFNNFIELGFNRDAIQACIDRAARLQLNYDKQARENFVEYLDTLA